MGVAELVGGIPRLMLPIPAVVPVAGGILLPTALPSRADDKPGIPGAWLFFREPPHAPGMEFVPNLPQVA